MDFHSMKRAALQTLCKKHGIPANLKNGEMADRLASIYKDSEESNSQERSSLSTVDEVEEEDVPVGKKPAKKVKFSPDCETFTYEASVQRRVARRKSMGRSLPSNPDPVGKVAPKAEESKKSVNGRTRTTRSRAEKVEEEEEVSVAISPPAGKKRGRRSVANVKFESSELGGGVDKMNEGAIEHPKRSRRNTGKPGEVEKAEVISRSRRSRAQSKEVSEGRDEHLDEPEKEVDTEINETHLKQVQEVTVASQVEKQDVKDPPKRTRRNTRKTDEVEKVENVSKTRRLRAHCEEETSGAQEKEVLIVESNDCENEEVVTEKNETHVEQVQEVTVASQVDKKGVKDYPKRPRRNTRKTDEVEKVVIVSKTRRLRAHREEETSGAQDEPLDVPEKEVLIVESNDSKNEKVDTEKNETHVEQVEQIQEVTVASQVEKQGVKDRPKRPRRNTRKTDEVQKVEIVSKTRRLRARCEEETSGPQDEPLDVPAKEVLIVESNDSKNDEVDNEKNETEIRDSSVTAAEQVQEVAVLCQVDQQGVNDRPKRLTKNARKTGKVEKAETVSRTRRSRAHCKEETSGAQGEPSDVLEKEVLMNENSESNIHVAVGAAEEKVQKVTIMSQVDKQAVRVRPKRSRRNIAEVDEVEKVEPVSRSRRLRAQRDEEASGVHGEPTDVLEGVVMVENKESRNDGVGAEENETNSQENQELMELHESDVISVEQVQENKESRNDGVDAEENETNSQENQELMELHESDVISVEQVQENKESRNDGVDAEENETNSQENQELVELREFDVVSAEQVQENKEFRNDGVHAEENEKNPQENQELMELHESDVISAEQVQESKESRNDGVDAENETNSQENQELVELHEFDVVSAEQVRENKESRNDGVHAEERNDGVDAENETNSQENQELVELHEFDVVSAEQVRENKESRNDGVHAEENEKSPQENQELMELHESDVISAEQVQENKESSNDGVDAEENETNFQENQKLMELHNSDVIAAEQVQEVSTMDQADNHGEVDSSRIEEISAANSSGGEEVVVQNSLTEESIDAATDKQETPADSHHITDVEKSPEAQWSINEQSVGEVSISTTESRGPLLIAESATENPGDLVHSQVVKEEAKEGNIQSTHEPMLNEDSQQAKAGEVTASLGDTVTLDWEVDGQLCETLGSGGTTAAAADVIDSVHKESESNVNMDSDEKTSTPVNFSITNQKEFADKPPTSLNFDQETEAEETSRCENMSQTIDDVEDKCIKAPVQEDMVLEFNDKGVISAEPEREVIINDDQNQLFESNGLRCMSPTPFKNVEEADSNALSVEEKLPQVESSYKAIDSEETWDASFLDAIESCFEKTVERHENASASRPAPESQVEDTVTKGETDGGCSPEKKAESEPRSKHFAYESAVKCCEDTDLVVHSKGGLVEDKTSYESCQALSESNPLDNANSIEPETVEFQSSNQSLSSYVLALPANGSSPSSEVYETYGLSQLFDSGNALEKDEPSSGENKDLKNDSVDADGQISSVHEHTKLENLEEANLTPAKAVQEVTERNAFGESSEQNILKGESEVSLKKDEEVSVPDCPAGGMIGQIESSVKSSPEAGNEKVATMDHNATVGSPLRLECSSQDNTTISQFTVEKESQGPDSSLKKLPEESLNNLVEDLSDMEGVNSVSFEERDAGRIENASTADTSSPPTGLNDRLQDIKVMIDDFEAIFRDNGDVRALPDNIPAVSSPQLALDQMESQTEAEAKESENEAAMEDGIVIGFEASPLKESSVLDFDLVSTKSDHEQLVGEKSAHDGQPEQTLSEDYSAARECSKTEKHDGYQYQVTDVPSDVEGNEITASGEGIGCEFSMEDTDDSPNSIEGLEDLFNAYTVEEHDTDEVPMEFSDEDEDSLRKAMFDDTDSIMVEQLPTPNQEKIEASESKEMDSSDSPNNNFDVTAEGSKDPGSCEKLVASSMEETEMGIDASADNNLNDYKTWDDSDELHYFTSWEMNMFCGGEETVEETHPEQDSGEEFKENAVQSAEEQFDGNEHFMVAEVTNLDESNKSDNNNDEYLKMEDEMPQATSDTSILQKSSEDVSNELAAADNVPKEDCAGEIVREEEASKSIEDASGLDVPAAADQPQLFMDVGKDSASDGSETLMPMPDLNQSTKSDNSDGEHLKMEDDIGSLQASSDTTFLQKSSQDVAADKSLSGFDDNVPIEDSAAEIVREEALNSIEDFSGLDVPAAADQPQLLMDVGKDIASDANLSSETLMPTPEHKNAEAEKESSTLFTKQTSISIEERMSKTTFVPKMAKKLKPESIHDMKENLMSPKWHQKASKTAPKPSSKRRALEDVPKHQF